MTITCPACSGTSLRELTPGFYECTSPIDASIPPGLAGNPGWLHGSRPCGHRFQAGPALATEPCWCGRHSIGSCRDCKRPLCGLHGTADGELLCGECVTASAERRRAREAEAAAAHERSLETRGRDLSANLATCSSAGELLTLLGARAAAVPYPDALRAAWTRVIANDGLQATHDVVALAGHPTLGSPFTWKDFKKRGSWSESGQRSIVWLAPEAGYRSELGHTNTDVWIGAQGDVWWGTFPETLGFGKHDGPKTCHYVLGRGEHVRLKRGFATYQNFHTLPGGVPVALTVPEPEAYASVVEIALKHGL
jgi:hypothetical protein